MRNLKVLAWLLCSMMPVVSGLSVAGDETPEDRVSFQVEAGRDVENDRVTAVMNVTAENDKPAELADMINSTMQWALEQVYASARFLKFLQ